jgi:hypothetical protein
MTPSPSGSLAACAARNQIEETIDAIEEVERRLAERESKRQPAD